MSATAEFGQSALFGSQKIAGSAQLQVHIGDFEAIVGFGHGGQPGSGVFALFEVGHQDAVTLSHAPADAPSQLMQL
jgi:hypothetical protein